MLRRSRNSSFGNKVVIGSIIALTAAMGLGAIEFARGAMQGEKNDPLTYVTSDIYEAGERLGRNIKESRRLGDYKSSQRK